MAINYIYTTLNLVSAVKFSRKCNVILLPLGKLIRSITTGEPPSAYTLITNVGSLERVIAAVVVLFAVTDTLSVFIRLLIVSDKLRVRKEMKPNK